MREDNIESEESGKVINAKVCEMGRVSAALGARVVTVGHRAALHDEGAGVAVHVGRVDARVWNNMTHDFRVW